MAITHRGVGTVAAAAGADITPGLPASSAANDVCVCFIETAAGEAPTMTGWTEAPDSPIEPAASTTRLTIFWRRLTGTDPTDIEASSLNHAIARIGGWIGVTKTGNPFNVTAPSTDTDGGTGAVILGDTTTVAGCAVIAACCTTRDATTTTGFDADWTNASLASITEIIDNGTASGSGGGIGVAWGIKTAAGTYSSTTVTLAIASDKGMWSGALTPEIAPTIVHSTADTIIFNRPLPGISATATDVNGSDVRYQVQVEAKPFANYDFDEATGASSLNPTIPSISQSFVGTGAQLTHASFLLHRAGDPPGNIRAILYAETGATFGTDSVPDGAALATSDPIDCSVLATSAAMQTFTFSTPYTPANGTEYCIVLTADDTASWSSEVINASNDNTTPTHAGNLAVHLSGVWTPLPFDLVFMLYSRAPIFLDKISSADAGFVNQVSGGDTSPFNSGEKVTYTIQAADVLANGDYRQRWRADDPNGSATFSSWLAYQTFSVRPSPPAALRVDRWRRRSTLLRR